MRIFLMSAVLGAVALAGAAQAQSYRAENRVVVTPSGGGSFSVPSSGKYGARGAWCAAASFAQDVQGASGTTRIYVQQPKASNSGPVIFGTTPGGTTPVAVLGTTAALRTAGSNLSIDHAMQFCQDVRLRNGR
jgi:hypothetical protein